MSSLHNPENTNNSHAAHPSLEKRTEEQTPYSEREVIEATLDALAIMAEEELRGLVRAYLCR